MSRDFALNSFLSFAVPAAANFTVLTANTSGAASIGEPVYVVTHLRDSLGRFVYAANNVQFVITGGPTGLGPPVAAAMRLPADTHLEPRRRPTRPARRHVKRRN